MDTTAPSTFAGDVARNVVAAMESRGKTNLGISEATGIPRTTLLRRLGGHSAFTVAELDAVAEALEMDVRDLTARGVA